MICFCCLLITFRRPIPLKSRFHPLACIFDRMKVNKLLTVLINSNTKSITMSISCLVHPITDEYRSHLRQYLLMDLIHDSELFGYFRQDDVRTGSCTPHENNAHMTLCTTSGSILVCISQHWSGRIHHDLANCHQKGFGPKHT